MTLEQVQGQAQENGRRAVLHRVTLEGHSFTCGSAESVLAAMVRQGVKTLQVGCRGGGCGVCRVQVLEGQFRCGKMARNYVSEADADRGFALACRLYPESDLVLVSAPPPLPPRPISARRGSPCAALSL